MKWMRGYAGLMLLIIAAYLYASYKRPPVVDWTITLDRHDRIPFGSYILHDRLPDLFDARIEHPEGTIYERYNERTDTGELSIILARSFKTSPVDDAEWLRFIAIGNRSFVAAEEFSQHLADTLKLESESQSFGFPTSNNDSIGLNLVAAALHRKKDYLLPASRASGHFTAFDTARTTVLGRNSLGQANFIRMRIGKGELFLHAAPLAFSNFSMLIGQQPQYVSDVLSYLPRKPAHLVWDDHFSSGKSGATTPLRVILTRPGLRAAYFTALAAIILFVLFRSKRRQRIIPVIEPLRNTTMDFVDTIAQLYLNKGNHQDIALKMINQFLEYVRTNLGLQTGVLDDEFIARLSQRAGVAPDITTALISRINTIRNSNGVSTDALMGLSRAIDAFKKTET